MSLKPLPSRNTRAHVRPLLVLWLSVVVVSLSLLAWAASHAWRAHDEHRRVRDAHENVQRSFHSITVAQRNLPVLAFRARPDLSGSGSADSVSTRGTVATTSEPSASLAARLGDVLRTAGVPAQALTSLQPDGESVLAQNASPTRAAASNAGASGAGASSVQVKRAQAVAVLEGITLPQLGKVFEALRRREPDWRVASIDLSPMPIGKNSAVAQRGGDAPLRAVLTLQSEYLTPPLPRIEVASNLALKPQDTPHEKPQP